MSLKKYDDDIPEGHAFAETRATLSPRDQRLRRFGWHIHARPRQGEPVWERGGVLVPQAKALAICDQEEKAG